MTATIDIARKRGDTRRLIFAIQDSGVAVDISAWTSFVLTVDPSKAPADTSANLEQMTGALTTDGTDGRVHFIPSGTIAPGAYYYDAQALDANGEKYTFAQGKYKVTQDITKS
jgi:hypothetical protein